eukprot:g21128.t1
MEPGQAIQWALQVVHPFTVSVALEEPVMDAIAALAHSPSDSLARRIQALAFWEHEAHRLLPDSVRRIAALPDGDLRRLLLGCSEGETPALGQVCHIALYEAMAAACGSVDQHLAQDLLCGFSIVGPIARSGRWPDYTRPQPHVAVEDALARAWDLRMKIVQRVQSDLVCNAKQAVDRLGWTTRELGARWDELQLGSGKVKFGGGFYCGCLNGLYVINGFYMAMRAKYISPDSSVYWMHLNWKSSCLTWRQFREEIVGDTDPATAAESQPGSIRGHFFKQWSEFGLEAQPEVGNNVVHGSASPLEALIERMTWLGAGEDDPFAKILRGRGIEDSLKRWRLNPVARSTVSVRVDNVLRSCLGLR